MRILFIADVSIHQVIGGAERVLFEQAIGLHGRGHEIHIMTRLLPEHKGAVIGDIQGIREWRYAVKTDHSSSFFFTTLLNGSRLFRDLRKSYRFDCINAHQPFSALVALKNELPDIAFFYTCHSLSFEEYLSRQRAFGRVSRLTTIPQVLMRKTIERFVLSRARKIIVLSTFTKEKLQQMYGFSGDRIVINPAGVNLTCFRPSLPTERVVIRQRLGIPQEFLVLLTVRNLVPRMGLENLIMAMKHVSVSIPDSMLIIGGSGPLREKLITLRDELMLSNRIFFPGFIPENELADYYRAADLFILPTVELEGFGLVTLEALASGTPVLGTPVGGTVEILGKFDPRFLFRSPGVKDMSDLIIETCRHLRENPDYKVRLSAQCRHFVEKHYSWERNVDQLESILLGKAS